ncbi:tetratricopeptide repeat-containing sensor histidine kinase [Sunxiuqinia sp. A32]|uniref:tetratricopeptide repeat-containing sensor histidine kinase n=1 Tax=Sunxiuqinia sp. A32 TaxID=3461496 RepID=UPI0040460399
MKKLFLLTCIFFLGNIIHAQNSADSLKSKLLEATGQEHAEILLELAKFYSKTDSFLCVQYSSAAIAESTELFNKDIIASSYYQIGETYYYFDNYSGALESYQRAMNYYVADNDSSNIAECYNSIGLVYYYTGEYNIAIENLYKALKTFNKIGNKDEEAHVYSNIAMVYSRIKDYSLAAENYRMASLINMSIEDKGSLSVNYNGLGVTYYNLEKYDSSKVYYNKALQLFKELGNQQRQAIALNNIANIYVNSGDSLNQALSYYEEALHVFRDLKDTRNVAFVMEGLGSVYRELGDYNSALSVFQECLYLVNAHKFGYYLSQLVYSDIALTYEKMGRITDAYNAYKLYNLYNDSLLQEERMDQVAELGKKYEIEKKEAEIDRLNALQQVHELQISRDKQVRGFGIIMIILLLVITFIVSIGYLDKRKTNQLLSIKNSHIEKQRKELEKINASKNKFFSIIAHDLKNPFHTVMGYSYLMHKEYKRFKDDEREKYAADIYRSTHSIFRLLQNLLDWSRSQTGRLNFEPRQFVLADLYESTSGLIKPTADSKNIKLVSKIDQGLIAFADPMMIETILRNLISNAIKFTREDGWVKTVALSQNEKLLICVEDNGIGIKPNDLKKLFKIDSKIKSKGTNNEDGSGLGLILCKEFVEKNGGSIWVESKLGEGSKFWFTIPSSNLPTS